MAGLQQAIEKQNAEFKKHYAARDMESLKNLYTDDCRLMPQGHDTMIGKQAIPEMFGEVIKAGGTSVDLIADEVGPLGPVGTDDMVYERGHYQFGKADGSVFGAGKYVVIWKKTSEGYKLYIDIFNDN